MVGGAEFLPSTFFPPRMDPMVPVVMAYMALLVQLWLRFFGVPVTFGYWLDTWHHFVQILLYNCIYIYSQVEYVSVRVAFNRNLMYIIYIYICIFLCMWYDMYIFCWNDMWCRMFGPWSPFLAGSWPKATWSHWSMVSHVSALSHLKWSIYIWNNGYVWDTTIHDSRGSFLSSTMIL